ncbi:hypothetical protein FB458_1913 [Lapillicoccus jejuensis]|uniref:Uncharacterized protein n=1 Tax=Lapillicoccus jejuensis TaxID=402171 RepID=A0A542E0D6_9MICO|nr:hypothetical protein FB458_1913 [Lapillicoccus jejuensis]
MLGVVVDGDLDEMRQGKHAVLPEAYANRSFQLSGKPGSGKTVTAERLVFLLAKMGRRIVYVDCKGTDPDLAMRLSAACIAARGPGVRVHHFPSEPLNGWIGTPAEVANRLIATQDTTEPYYESTLQTAVRVAMGVHASQAAGGTVTSSTELMRRFDAAFLTRAYQGTSQQSLVADLVRDRQVLPGVKMRFAALFEAVAGGFDGTASYGDADLIFLSLPFASKADATAVVRLLLADFTHYCSDPSRKDRRGDDVKMIIDEASALTHLSDQIIDLAERVRDVGGSVDVSNQSFEGSGDNEDQRKRLRGAMAGGTILHSSDNPEPFGTADDPVDTRGVVVQAA